MLQLKAFQPDVGLLGDAVPIFDHTLVQLLSLFSSTPTTKSVEPVVVEVAPVLGVELVGLLVLLNSWSTTQPDAEAATSTKIGTWRHGLD